MKSLYLSVTIYLTFLAFESSANAQGDPPGELFSPDHQYSVKLLQGALPGSDPDNGAFTLSVHHGSRTLSNFPTIGHLINALWSPDGKYVAINNRRGNQGDYLWIIRLSDGHAIKEPADADPTKGEALAKKQAKELVMHARLIYPQASYDLLLKQYTSATNWTKADEFQMKTILVFHGPDNHGVTVWETYRVNGDQLVLIGRKVVNSASK